MPWGRGILNWGISFLNHNTGGLSSSLCQASTRFGKGSGPCAPCWEPLRLTITWIWPQGWDYLNPPFSLPHGLGTLERPWAAGSPQGSGAGSLMVPRTCLHFFGQCHGLGMMLPNFLLSQNSRSHCHSFGSSSPPRAGQENWRHKKPR